MLTESSIVEGIETYFVEHSDISARKQWLERRFDDLVAAREITGFSINYDDKGLATCFTYSPLMKLVIDLTVQY